MKNKTELKEKLSDVANKISNILLETSAKDNLKKSDIDEVITTILKTLGEVSRADRCYIWENYVEDDDSISDMHYMRQIYEWAEGVDAVQGTELIEFVPYDPITFDILSSKQNVNSIVKDLDEYNRSILEPQGIKSILVAPIHLSNNHFWGFIGFDNCHTEEIWEDFEEEILSQIGTNIGEFICKFKHLFH